MSLFCASMCGIVILILIVAVVVVFEMLIVVLVLVRCRPRADIWQLLSDCYRNCACRGLRQVQHFAGMMPSISGTRIAAAFLDVAWRHTRCAAAGFARK